MWLIDSYRKQNSIVLWLKTQDKDVYVEFPYTTCVYLEIRPLSTAALRHMPHAKVSVLTPLGSRIEVYKVPVPAIEHFEQFVRNLEQLTRYRVPMYNADIVPEQLFLYERGLAPFSSVRVVDGQVYPDTLESHVPLSVLDMQVYPTYSPSADTAVTGITVDGRMLSGSEEEILRAFCKYFAAKDPDVITVFRGFQMVPYLQQRLQLYGLSCSFHRWHETPLRYRGGKSFFSYGQVRYQDFAVRLNGRFLVDKTTMMGSTCDVEAIVELCQLSGTRFQQVASRSFGAVFQAGLVRQMISQGMVVPHKHKPVEKPLSMWEMLQADRAGHTFDPLIGFHTSVAEIDFASMYPWLIFNHNISAETIISAEGPFEEVPGTPIRISLARKGLVPLTIKPLIDRRMHYKKHPSRLNKLRAAGLKWVLVSSYGYLRFREFKMGLAASHMAICAFAREILMDSAKLAEEHGFSVVHGIIDALYVRKEGVTESEVRALCSEIEMVSGIPMSFEGVFKWVVFLPSVRDALRPVPTRYYGVFTSGDIKVRGIELRQRGVPAVVKRFQKECIERMVPCGTLSEVRALLPSLFVLLRSYIARLPLFSADELTCTLRISKIDYKHDIPQKKVLRQLNAQGITVYPGQSVAFVFGKSGVQLPEQFDSVNVTEYRKRLVRALFSLVQVFGVTMEEVEMAADGQMSLGCYGSLS